MSRKKRWSDVRLLSFDLQTVEFAYAADYTLSITCTDQLSPIGGTYDLQFSRITREQTSTGEDQPYNPHEDLEPYLRRLLQHGPLAPSSLRPKSLILNYIQGILDHSFCCIP